MSKFYFNLAISKKRPIQGLPLARHIWKKEEWLELSLKWTHKNNVGMKCIKLWQMVRNMGNCILRKKSEFHWKWKLLQCFSWRILCLTVGNAGVAPAPGLEAPHEAVYGNSGLLCAQARARPKVRRRQCVEIAGGWTVRYARENFLTKGSLQVGSSTSPKLPHTGGKQDSSGSRQPRGRDILELFPQVQNLDLW